MLTNTIFSIHEAYCVVAVESIGRQVPIACLERIKDDFTKKYGGGKAPTATANSLNKGVAFKGPGGAPDPPNFSLSSVMYVRFV
ncbi:putative Longin domain-containing protein [Helianthus debilis subsp. tardiflorus]